MKIVIAPAKLYPKSEWVEFSEESCRKAIQLTEEYRQIAAIHKAHFLSAAEILDEKCIGSDGIHFTEEGHRRLAEEILLLIKNICEK